MKLLLTILALSVGTTSAIVCPSNFCANYSCPELTQESCVAQNAVLKPNATFCGCCPNCIRQLSMIIIVVIIIVIIIIIIIIIVININNFDPFCR
jgi:hypothetical protein